MLYWSVLLCILPGFICAQSEWILEASELPSDLRLIPAVGNGHVATQVYHDTIYLNNVYNGYEENSHRARVPSSVAVIIDGNVEQDNYALDMYTGSFQRTLFMSGVDVEQRVFAPRSRPTLLVNEIHVSRPTAGEEVAVAVTNNRGNESEDMQLTTEEYDQDTWYTQGSILEPETDSSDFVSIHQYWTKIPDNLVLAAEDTERTWHFVTSISIDNQEALQAYEEAKQDEQELFDEHSQVWASIWSAGDIEVSDNITLAQTFHAGLYHILSSTPDVNSEINSFAGLSPGGLARGGKIANSTGGPYNDYAGHVFWDMDTWIMPPVMMFHPTMAKTMIQSRIRVIDAVRDRASQAGFSGVMYPWEQAYTGYETCPWDLASLYQIHITADVSYSVRQYLYSTNDDSFITEDDEILLSLVRDIADFWESRSEWSEEHEAYVINGVMGPDEYASNVNNSVFTNYNARLSLEMPLYLLEELDIPGSDDDYENALRQADIGRQLVIVFDEENQYHPQYEGFEPENTVIKQSDVVLLGYPLMMDMTPEVRRNDLIIYENITDKFGPDTGTWSMHTVGWLELGEYDKANDMFWFMFRNINGPFKIFSEKPADAEDGMRATNFITGAGGMLQAVLFGYAGMKLESEHLVIDPYPLPESPSWTVRGINYRDSELDMSITETSVSIEVIEGPGLMLNTDAGDSFPLLPGQPQTIPRQRAVITSAGDNK